MNKRQAMFWWPLASAALMLVGAFGPWIKVLGTSVSGTDGNNDGWLVVATAIVAGGLFYLTRKAKLAGLWPLIGGVVGTAIAIYDRDRVNDAIDKGGAFAQALASVGWGLNLTLIASISFGAAGVVWLIKHEPQGAAPAVGHVDAGLPS